MEREAEKGASLITVLVLTSVLFLLGLALASVARINAHLAGNRLREAQAFYLAEAGLAAAEARLRVNPAGRSPFSGALSTGSYEVKFEEERASGNRRTVRVTAKGHAGNAQKTITGIFTLEPYPQHPAFDYALYMGDEGTLDLSGNITVNGDVFANGDIDVRGSAEVTGSVSAAGEVFSNKEDRVEGGVFSGVSPIAPPWSGAAEEGFAFYRKLAATVLPGGATVQGQSASPGLIFVEGDATVTGTFPAGTAVVATGRLTVKGDVETMGGGLLFLAAKEEILAHGHDALRAILYTPGTLTLTGRVSLMGTAVAGTMRLTGHSSFTYVKPVTGGLAVPLPGLVVKRSIWYENFATITTK
ncbi:MAG: hypothetical protein PWP58_391 [Bacillota bacterium]|jgi:cytoskeletal protein CcmA (bactofilin family)|nr:hypothetical protein [Bacillota bacterium]